MRTRKIYSTEKGQTFPSDIGMTLIFMLLVVGMLTIATLIAATNFFTSNKISYKVDFLPLANKPFVIADVLGYVKAGDRSFIEQAIETSATGSPDAAGAIRMIDELKTLMKVYKPKQYAVSIKSGLSTVASIDSFGKKCGQVLEGWCTGSQPGCDVGYVEIDGKGACLKGQVCCKFDTVRYDQTGNKRGKFDVVRCGGDNDPGTCSEGDKKLINSFDQTGIGTAQLGPYCGDGQYELSNSTECKNRANIKTQLCCAQRADEAAEGEDLTTATIPLLYKNTVGFVEVNVI